MTAIALLPLAFLNPHMESIKDFSTYAVQNGYIGSTD
jgi:hypothetical protein